MQRGKAPYLRAKLDAVLPCCQVKGSCHALSAPNCMLHFRRHSFATHTCELVCVYVCVCVCRNFWHCFCVSLCVDWGRRRLSGVLFVMWDLWMCVCVCVCMSVYVSLYVLKLGWAKSLLVSNSVFAATLIVALLLLQRLHFGQDGVQFSCQSESECVFVCVWVCESVSGCTSMSEGDGLATLVCLFCAWQYVKTFYGRFFTSQRMRDFLLWEGG